MPTFYEILGLNEGAEPKEVRRAYLKTMRKVHPDRPGAGAIDTYNFSATEVNIAYETLSDSYKREAYDRELGNYKHPGPCLQRIDRRTRSKVAFQLIKRTLSLTANMTMTRAKPRALNSRLLVHHKTFTALLGLRIEVQVRNLAERAAYRLSRRT